MPRSQQGGRFRARRRGLVAARRSARHVTRDRATERGGQYDEGRQGSWDQTDAVEPKPSDRSGQAELYGISGLQRDSEVEPLATAGWFDLSAKYSRQFSGRAAV